MACLVFELLTGDYLFDPKHGDGFKKDDDHLAQMIELTGNFPKSVALKGKHSSKFFNRKGELRNIHKFKIWGLADVLHEKYEFSRLDSKEISSFLSKMLTIRTEERASAEIMLQHPWLSGVDLDQ